MERGAASNVLAIVEYGGVPVHEQDQLTPFQRHVIIKGAKKQQEEAQDSSGGDNSFPGPTNQPPTNTMRQPKGGAMQGDTITYVNQHEGERYDDDGVAENGIHFA